MWSQLISLAPVVAGLAIRSGGQYVPEDMCCFTLHDSNTDEIIKQETRTGFLFVGGHQPDGWYCIELSDPNKILWDQFNNACFVASDKKFTCLDPTPSMDQWAIEQSGGDVLVTVNGDSGFDVCDKGMVYSDGKPDKTGCAAVQLKAQGLQGTCGNLKAS